MQTEQISESSSQLEPGEDSTGKQTAGDVLRAERQRLGLNEKEVADQLHITMHYVKALESDSYEKLPGAVFARGYLKSYALLIGLDVDDVLSRYDEFANQQKADSDEENRLLRARKKKDRNKPFVIASLVVFVIGFLGLWIANSFLEEELPTTVESVDTSEGDESLRPALSRAVEQVAVSQDQLSLDVEPEPEVTNTAPVAVEPDAASEQTPDIAASIVEVADDGNAEDGENDGGTSIEDLAAALQALRAEQAIAAEQAAADQPRVIAIDSAGNDVLRISFTGESWVEVNDSDTQQVYRDIREAGDVLEITGSAPFSILLGDAPFTRMSLNGDEIDLSADIRIDNSARLTVGL